MPVLVALSDADMDFPAVGEGGTVALRVVLDLQLILVCEKQPDAPSWWKLVGMVVAYHLVGRAEAAKSHYP